MPDAAPPPQGARPRDASRSVNSPQWPLGTSLSISTMGSGSNLLPSGRPQPEPEPRPRSRPARPAQDMSDDASLSRPPIPFFVARSSLPGSPREQSGVYNAASLADTGSRLTTSSVGTIPDFPIPGTIGLPPPPRRSAALGPPPSSRRGLSSMYYNSSFVSPIPEESPRSRGSYASSAAMPGTWGTASPLPSPGDRENFFDDSISERSRDSTLEDDYGDENQLVRGAGYKGETAFVDAPSNSEVTVNPAVTAITPFVGGTAYYDGSTSSMIKPSSVMTPRALNQRSILTPDAILKAYAAASLSDPAESRGLYTRASNRFSILRPPSRLGMPANDERSSLTSLPDLIRRATRLASLIDKGKRPASRLDDLSGSLSEKTGSRDGETSLSDMLAAFPPPAQTTTRNDSHSQSSSAQTELESQTRSPGASSPHGTGSRKRSSTKRGGRRCCGLPVWAVIVVTILALCLIVVAIIVPLEFFVFRKIGTNQSARGRLSSIENCRKALTCFNGGINVLLPAMCACICTNDFTGFNCEIAGSQGCTSTRLVSADGATGIDNVTLGDAMPQLIASAESQFSVPLSGTIILSRFNNFDFSCMSQNSLVTFEGRTTRNPEAQAAVALNADANVDLPVHAEEVYYYPSLTIIFLTLIPLPTQTFPRDDQPKKPTTKTTTTKSTRPLLTTSAPTTTSASTRKTANTALFPTSTRIATPTATAPDRPGPPNPASTNSLPALTIQNPAVPTRNPRGAFTIDEEVLDFARISILYIVEKQDVEVAEAAQATLRRFFSKVTRSGLQADDGPVGIEEASNVSLGGKIRVNLVDFSIDVGKGPVGRRKN